MRKPRADDIRIATEAAQWQHALGQGGTARHVEFIDWMKASPRHLREFLFMEALDAAAEKIDPALPLDLDAPFPDPAGNIVPLRNAAVVAVRKRKSLWLTAAAVGCLVTALGATWWIRPELLGGWQRYDTAVGEQRSVHLRDGSILQLNTASRVRVRFSSDARDIELVAGEALFKVARDSALPFRVRAGDTVIRALGTQFNVYRRARGIKVLVVEGRVEVSHAAVAPGGAVRRAQLDAGEAAHVEPGGAVVRENASSVTEVTAWQQRRLVFREESLGAIAQEFNRYNLHPQIVIEDETVRARRLGGTFDADDPETLVRFALRSADLEAQRSPGRILIRPRQ